MISNGEYMGHVPMCRMCGEFEIGMFAGGTMDFCSAECDAEFAEYDTEYDTDGAPIDTQGWYDDEPSPYSGTYSED